MNERMMRAIAKAMDIPVESIDTHADLMDIPGWDSVMYYSVLSCIGQEFGIKFTREELTDVECLADIMAIAEQKAG